MSTLINTSIIDKNAIKDAIKQSAQDKIIQEAGKVIDTQKAAAKKEAEAAAKKNPSQKSMLPKQDQENIDKIMKNPKTVDKLNEMLQDPSFQEAFCYSSDFRSIVLSNAASTGLPDSLVKSLKETAKNNETQKDIKDTKETLKKTTIKYDNEKQRKYFEEKKKIEQMDENKQVMNRLINIGSGLFTGDRACMTDAMMNIVGMGASMGKFGKFGGAFQLLSGFLGKDRFSSYLSGDFNNTRGQDNAVSEQDKTAANNTVLAAKDAMRQLA